MQSSLDVFRPLQEQLKHLNITWKHDCLTKLRSVSKEKKLREQSRFNQTWLYSLITSGMQLCSFSGNTLSPLKDYGAVRKGLLVCQNILKWVFKFTSGPMHMKYKHDITFHSSPRGSADTSVAILFSKKVRSLRTSSTSISFWQPVAGNEMFS